MQLLLKNGRVIDPSQGLDKLADVLVDNGVIAEIAENITLPCHSDPESSSGDSESITKVIDCTGLIIAPGLIDMHVHLREPGYEHKETIATGAAAACAGGFTTILGMPNTSPAIDTGAIVEFVLNKGKQTPINVLTTGAATKANAGKEMAEIGEMISSGAVAISDDAFPVQSSDLMRLIMEYSKMFDVPVLVHCEDKAMTPDSVMNEGIICSILGLKPWPRQAEEIMVWRNILLSQLTGCKLHIQHVSTAGSIEAVKWAKTKGINVTCETCPQYFSLTDQALNQYDTNAKISPPLRTQADVDAIKAALKDGSIDVIATDHAPHATEDKEVELQYAAFGMTGLETALSLVITNLVNTGVLTINEAIQKMTKAPADVLGLKSGTLTVGAAADITVIDANAKVKVNAKEFKSKGKNTPLDGAELTGKAVFTIAGGKVVFGD